MLRIIKFLLVLSVMMSLFSCSSTDAALCNLGFTASCIDYAR